MSNYICRRKTDSTKEDAFSKSGMLSNAVKEEEVVKTVLPVKAAKQEVVVEPEDDTEREDDTKVPLWRTIFRKLRFSECLILILVISACRRKTNSTKRCFFKEPKKASALTGFDTCGRGLMV